MKMFIENEENKSKKVKSVEKSVKSVDLLPLWEADSELSTPRITTLSTPADL